jgi:DNA polymerase-1
MTENRLFLIDALALIYRSFNNVRTKSINDSKKIEEATVSGFFEILNNILQTQKPSHFAIAFDIKKPTFRHELYPKYKAHRKAMPIEIANAVIEIKRILQLSNIRHLELEGYEADDIIGTVAKHAEKEGFKVYLVSPDKDFFQLVDDAISIYKLKKSGKEARVIDVTEVRNMYSIADPSQLIDLFAFSGDDSDNIPSVHGFGKRCVKKLLSEFGSIDAMYSNLDKMTAKQSEMLLSQKDNLMLSKKLVTIDIHVPIDFNMDSFQVKNFKLKQIEEQASVSL